MCFCGVAHGDGGEMQAGNATRQPARDLAPDGAEPRQPDL